MIKQNKIIRSISILRRIKLLVVLISIIPIVFISFFFYERTFNGIYETAKNYNIILMNTFKDNLNTSILQANTFSDELMILDSNRNLLNNYENMSDKEINNSILSLDNILRYKIWLLKNAAEVKFFTKDFTSAYSMKNVYRDSKSFEQDLLKIEAADNYELWFVSDTFEKPTIVNARKMLHPGTLEVFGYQLIYLYPSFLGDISIKSIFDNKGELFFIDSLNNVFLYDGKTLSRDNIEQNNLSFINGVRDSEKSDNVNIYKANKDNFICYSTNKKINWTIISKIPNKSLYKPAYSIFPIFVISCIILLFISLIFSKIIIKSIRDPLDKLMDSIEKASEKKFDIPFVDENTDELSYLGNAFNKIIIKTNSLVKQIEQEQDSIRKSEIRMLQAQINPHFLFNTLDSLKFAAIMSNAVSVSEGLSSLSKLLRNSIIKENAKITIREEINNIEDYLTIQKIRQGNIINFEYDIQENCLDMKIMKLLLQPIVENSVIHGINGSSELSIRLICRYINNNIVIKIVDNGIGFSQDENSTKKSYSFSRVGLNNVTERLYLEYKDKQLFKIKSIINKGTTVIIKYPGVIEDV